MRYDKPSISREGQSADFIKAFGGVYKNPSITDSQGCSADGLCPAEADE